MHSHQGDHFADTGKDLILIDSEAFYQWLGSMGVDFFTGVPDSLLKDFCQYLSEHAGENHVVSANEGCAVALACGYHLATGKTPLVYMQNSGQGNAINPLLSLADRDVYGIPLLLLIGYRGEAGIKDEPQHVKQGKVTISLLETLGIACKVLDREAGQARKDLRELLQSARTESAPVALVVRKGTFAPRRRRSGDSAGPGAISREKALQCVVDSLAETDVMVATTGKISRELYEYRQAGHGSGEQDFLTVGSMGHASQIAMGIALAKPGREVFCLDGDGAMLMHMGSAAIIGAGGTTNLKHIILNNGAHDSVGGMATVGFAVNFTQIARGCGYADAWSIKTLEEIAPAMAKLRDTTGPALLEIRVRKGAREDLGRPNTTPKQNKAAFMNFLSR
ncbi:MAG: phosphonopyruvate decarboxylase [Planctomycetes bacterium]|nr:phosphonopyruvate decarboxylase [Planctomycetota bacterium]